MAAAKIIVRNEADAVIGRAAKRFAKGIESTGRSRPVPGSNLPAGS